MKRGIRLFVTGIRMAFRTVAHTAKRTAAHTARRVAVLLLAVLLLLPFLASCGGGGERGEKSEIVCTIYPIYDFVLSVVGDRVSDYPVRLLADDGNDPHNFQPSVSDMKAVSDAAILFCVGGSSDQWTQELSANGALAVPLLDAVTVCEGDHEGHGGEERSHSHAGHDHGAYDEHFWLSLSNAREAVAAILSALTKRFSSDEAAVAEFKANAEAYTEALTALDARYKAALDAESRTFDTLLVADRFPFLYLTRDYGLGYKAAFPGCSAECDASFSTVASLVEALKEKRLPAVLVTETGKRDLAETILREAGSVEGKILVLHSCQSVTKRELDAGVTYLSIMEQNLSVLRSALGA